MEDDMEDDSIHTFEGHGGRHGLWEEVTICRRT